MVNTAIMGTMLTRLGNVIYWAGCAAAALILCFAAYIGLVLPDKDRWGLAAAIAAVAGLAWVIGRAARYVLGGR